MIEAELLGSRHERKEANVGGLGLRWGEVVRTDHTVLEGKLGGMFVETNLKEVNFDWT